MTDHSERALALARVISDRFAALPPVIAVTAGGSLATGTVDEESDVDLYVYASSEVPVADRRDIARDFAGPDGRVELDNRFWEPGDEWQDAQTGVRVDIMYRSPEWIEEQLARVMDRHEASVGYSTCLWHNVLTSITLHDGGGWYAWLKEKADQPYPEPLRRNIIARNYPILRDNHSCYARQIEKALHRRDRINLVNRCTAFLDSYFDILFAANRAPHPGEKRLLQQAAKLEHAPRDLQQHVTRLLAGTADDWVQQRTPEHVGALVDALDEVLLRTGARGAHGVQAA